MPTNASRRRAGAAALLTISLAGAPAAHAQLRMAVAGFRTTCPYGLVA
jgi:hypothetical protein